MKLPSRRTLHAIFEAGIFLKAVDSLGEMTLGFLFYFLTSRAVNNFIFFISGDELTEQQRDPIWRFFFHGFAGMTTEVQHFWGLILVAHGIMKLFLVFGLLKNKLWIYPVSGIAFACFAVYQTYHLLYDPSPWLTVLTFLDFIFVGLIFHEYSYQKRARAAA